MSASHSVRRRSWPSRLAVPVVIAVGVITGALLAARAQMPADDALSLLGITAVVSIVCAGIGLWMLRAGRPRGMTSQASIVAATACAVVALGIVAAADEMFISVHDRDVLFVVVAFGGSAALAAALQLASSFDADAANVRRITEGLGTAQSVHTADFRIREMEQLAGMLTDAKARVERARERERAIEASRRELVAWISHDLRSPLASIRALAEALEDEVVTDGRDVARYHRSIRLESERLSALVDDLFELSKLQAGTERDTSDTIEVGELVADAVAAIDALASAKRIRVIVDIDSVSPASVPALDVLRIVRNLLDNAIRHTPPGGLVRLDGRADGDAVALAVSDQCGGIPEADLPRVFDVAFRGDAARQRDGSSGGLGLTIARGLAEAHAGSLEVRNLDGGCRFQVRIPTSSAPARREHRPA